MAETTYDGLFLLDPDEYHKDAEAAGRHVVEAIERCGGSVLVSRLWDERRLAYPIQGHRKAIYWLVYFTMSGENVASLTRECRISDVIMRELIIKVDPRVADTVVEHARMGVAAVAQTAGVAE